MRRPPHSGFFFDARPIRSHLAMMSCTPIPLLKHAHFHPSALSWPTYPPLQIDLYSLFPVPLYIQNGRCEGSEEAEVRGRFP